MVREVGRRRRDGPTTRCRILSIGLFGLVFAYFVNAPALRAAVARRGAQNRSTPGAREPAAVPREGHLPARSGPARARAPRVATKEDPWLTGRGTAPASPTRASQASARASARDSRPPAVAHRGHGRRGLPHGARHRRSEPALPRPAYAEKTKWGGLLAPYIMIQTMDTLRSVGHSGLPEGLPGVHSIWTGSRLRVEAAAQGRRRDPRRVLSQGGRRAREQVRRRPLRLPDLRGRLLRPDRRQDRAPQRHLDPHRAPQDRRDEEVRRDRAREVDARADVERLMARVRGRGARHRALLGRRQGGRRAAAASEGPAHADRRDRLRVAVRHLPGRQQGRGATSTTSTRSCSSRTSRACPSRRSACTGTTSSPSGCSACPAPTTSDPSAAPG